MMVRTLFACLFLLPLSLVAEETTETDLRYWKGNIHTHSLWSDGDDFPEMIADWYREHDYNFLALSDHNVLSQGMRWMTVSKISERGGDTVLPKYFERFGEHWVETKGEPANDDYESQFYGFHQVVIQGVIIALYRKFQVNYAL